MDWLLLKLSMSRILNGNTVNKYHKNKQALKVKKRWFQGPIFERQITLKLSFLLANFDVKQMFLQNSDKKNQEKGLEISTSQFNV